jgi:hypothetical protein
VLWQGLSQNYNTGGVHIYCIDVKLQNRSTTDGSTDPNPNNNTSCHHVYVTTFTNGIDAKATQKEISVSPNPAGATACVTYSLEQGSMVNLSITDLQGRVVMQAVNESQAAGDYKRSIDISSLNAGIYFVSFTSGGKVFTAKLVKQ